MLSQWTLLSPLRVSPFIMLFDETNILLLPAQEIVKKNCYDVNVESFIAKHVIKHAKRYSV